MTTKTPSLDATATRTCPTCGGPFTPNRHRRYCSETCRKKAWWRNHANTPADTAPAPAAPRRDHTVYECPTCEVRYLGEQRCPDCATFCRKIGPGGFCPHCDEPVAHTDLTPEEATTNPIT
ncbi:MAG TPA: zinc finger MYND domain-containing protein [Acidimicrobiia bacterium]|jgi:endogenous inhibitor of DNA gyrase (YacG/DUF329 family)